MNAEIIAVGTELLMGQIANTNAQYISQELARVGINVYYHSVVGDNRIRLIEIIEYAMDRSDVLIFTGGLGPTQDDITKETIAEVLGLPLSMHKESEERLKVFLKKISYPMVSSNLKQALIPEGAFVLNNNNGTAPGCVINCDKKIIVLLPGPPKEMKPMFNDFLNAYLKESNQIIESKYIKIFGIGESTAEEKVIDLVENQSNPTIATYFSNGEVMLRVTARAGSQNEAEKLLAPILDEITMRFGEYVYSTEGEMLEDVVVGLLREQNKTISLAESCTGGMICSKITNVVGASQVLERGVVSYSNQSKMELLEVKRSTLEEYGAVSKEVAKQMAVGIRKISATDIGLSVTGVAGPGGGNEKKPIGLVYIGIADNIKIDSIELRLTGDRDRIRLMAALNALDVVRRRLNNNNHQSSTR